MAKKVIRKKYDNGGPVGPPIKNYKKEKTELVLPPIKQLKHSINRYIPINSAVPSARNADPIVQKGTQDYIDWYSHPETMKKAKKNTGLGEKELMSLINYGVKVPTIPVSKAYPFLGEDSQAEFQGYNVAPKEQIIYEKGVSRGVIGHERGHAGGQDTVFGPALMQVLGDATKQKTKNAKREVKRYMNIPEEAYGNFHQFRTQLGLKPGETIKDVKDLQKRVKASKTDTENFYQTFDDENIVKAINTIAQTGNGESPTYAKYGGVMRKKYALGSPVPEDPSIAITRSQIAQAKAAQKAAGDPLATGLNMFGNLAMSVGQQMMQKGISEGGGADGKGIAGFLNKNQGAMDSLFGTMQGIEAGASFAVGGVAQGVPINAEGNEIVETPGGEPVELEGASHENGGIDLTVPAGTEIYSQQLKGPDGRTMAARKKTREGKEAKLGKTLQVAPTDKLLRNAYKRTKQANAVVDAQDMNKMKIAQMITQMGEAYAMGGTVQKYALGGDTGYGEDGRFIKPVIDADPSDIPTSQSIYSDMNPSSTKSTSNFNLGLDNLFGNITAGDALGLYGQYKASTDPLKNTRAQRATDTPNINAYKDYGKRGLNELEKTKGYLEGQRASALGNLNLDRVAASSRNRAGARGINTLRSLDIATDVQAQKAKGAVNDQFNQMMAGIFDKAAGMMNQQDQMVMQGEAGRDAADRADKDAYYSAMAKDIATKNTGMQYIGKNINEMKTRNVTGKLLNKLSENFDVNAMTGEVSKNGVTVAKAGTWEIGPNGELIDKRTKKEIKPKQ